MSSHTHSIGTITFQRMAGILVILAGIVAITLLTAGQVSAQTPPSDGTAPVVTAQQPELRDFFGTVVSVGEDFLILDTEDGAVEVPVPDDTKIRLPRKKNATLADLVEGDRLALSLEEEDGLLVADKIVLIPEKTQTRHLPGVVTAVTATGATIESVTIEGLGAESETTTFTLSSTIIRFRNQQGIDELPPNLADIDDKFVVVIATRDPDTGALLTEALEIRVTQGKPKLEDDLIATGAPNGEPSNTAKIRGIFEGLDEEGNWVINGTTVAFDDATQIESAFVVGRPVEIDAALQADGSLLAVEAEAKGRGRASKRVTRLDGVFQGFDDADNWIVGGTSVTVDETTDTDGPPEVGQRLKVKALLQEDGTLRAREIENKGREAKGKDRDKEGKLEGVFQGIDEDGNWIVNGAKVGVGDLTEVEGSPAIGSGVEVKVTLQSDGSLLATKLEVEDRDSVRPVKRAKIRGNIEAIEDDGETLVIDGLRVTLSDLTEQEGEPYVGAFVKVEVSMQDGSLVAKEIEVKEEKEHPEVAKAKKVELKGIVEEVNEDGSVVVNGLTVAIGNLTKQKGEIKKGGFLKVEGFLRGGCLRSRGTGEWNRVRCTFEATSIEERVRCRFAIWTESRCGCCHLLLTNCCR